LASIVNVYLIKTESSFALIDTGFSLQRGKLKRALDEAGCRPRDLKLVVVTHADFDHAGNCTWLRKKYGAPIAVHHEEAGAVETGRMLRNRKSRQGVFFTAVVNLGGLFVFRRFKPDIIVADGEDLSQYGLDGKVVHIPGHSRGSIGVLTKDGDFFCGDLLTGSPRPGKNSLVDDSAEMDASIEKMKTLGIKIVYPGHGLPFTMDELEKDRA
jgi:hydroxyacylglutathione hydrolase